MWSPNRYEWLVAALGILGAGGAVVPVNTRFKGEEVRYILDRSGARVVFTVGEFLDDDYAATIAGLRGRRCPTLRRGRRLRRRDRRRISRSTSSRRSGDAIDDARQSTRASARCGGDDVSDVLFTSGTTGAPKGVLMTHAQTLRQFSDWCDMAGLVEGDRYLIVNPFFHMFGYKAGCLASLMRGATIIPKPVFEVDDLLRTVAEESVTVFPGPPTVYQSILDHPDRDRYDLSTLRLAVTGAADIPVELIRRMHEELPFRLIVTGYGLTEAGHASPPPRPTTTSRPSPPPWGGCAPASRSGSPTTTAPSVPVGEAGELLVRGYSVMRGYLDDPDATAAHDRRRRLAAHRRPRDRRRARVRAHRRTQARTCSSSAGSTRTRPRSRTCCSAHPAVARVAVVGMPDARMGEVGMAFVVVAPGATLDPDELIAWARDTMANYKVPRAVEIVDELPVNAAGKVEKETLPRTAGRGRRERRRAWTPGTPTSSSSCSAARRRSSPTSARRRSTTSTTASRRDRLADAARPFGLVRAARSGRGRRPARVRGGGGDHRPRARARRGRRAVPRSGRRRRPRPAAPGSRSRTRRPSVGVRPVAARLRDRAPSATRKASRSTARARCVGSRSSATATPAARLLVDVPLPDARARDRPHPRGRAGDARRRRARRRRCRGRRGRAIARSRALALTITVADLLGTMEGVLDTTTRVRQGAPAVRRAPSVRSRRCSTCWPRRGCWSRARSAWRSTRRGRSTRCRAADALEAGSVGEGVLRACGAHGVRDRDPGPRRDRQHLGVLRARVPAPRVAVERAAGRRGPPPARARARRSTGSMTWTLTTRPRKRRSGRASVRGWWTTTRGCRRRRPTTSTGREQAEWHCALFDGGFFALTWPKRIGGQELPPVYEVIVDEELAAAGAPPKPGLGYLIQGITPARQRRDLRSVPARVDQWSGPVVPGVQRARRRFRPRVVADACGASTVTSTSSTGTRSGPATPTSPTGACCWRGPIRTRRSTRGSRRSRCRWTSRGSSNGRSR